MSHLPDWYSTLGSLFLVLTGALTSHGLRADEPPGAAVRAESTDAAVTEDVATSVLVNLIESLKTQMAEDESDVRVRGALRKACEQLLQQDAIPAAARHLARRELLVFRMDDLDDGVGGDASQRQKVTSDCIEIIRSGPRQAADAEFAWSLASRFEDFAPPSESRALYEAIGELFIRSPDEAVARKGSALVGAARRLSAVGQPLQLDGTTLAGDGFSIASLKGKYVLVTFWASWCVHSQEEIPNWQRCARQFHESGFEIVGVCLDDDPAPLPEYLAKHAMTWPQLHDAQSGPEHPAALHYGITAYPTTFLLDRQGRVLALDLRGKALQKRLASLCGSAQPQRRQFPVFRVEDVLNTFTSTATQWQAAGKLRSDVDFRRQLKRKRTELDLPEPSEELLTDRDAYQRACASVFVLCSLYRVEGGWETSLATAFAIADEGVLATNCHVFEGEHRADAVIAMDVHGKVFPVVEILAADHKSDTCLFRIDATGLQPLPLAEEAAPGTRVRVLGHPGDSFYYLSTGVIANYERDSEDATWMNITADFGQGSSGGPVLDEQGNVVGQVSRTYTLYAGGPTRGLKRRLAAAGAASSDAEDEVQADPQMVFKACVPVRAIRALVQPRRAADRQSR